MWPFKKKKLDITNTFELPKPPHEHIWKDMPWYMETEFNSNSRSAGYKIIEPYICITCGERVNKILEKEMWSGITPKEREAIYKRVRTMYKDYLKPRAVVEDMINNILLVKDASKLEMLEQLRGTPHRGVGTSSKMPRNDFQIHLERNRENANRDG